MFSSACSDMALAVFPEPLFVGSSSSARDTLLFSTVCEAVPILSRAARGL